MGVNVLNDIVHSASRKISTMITKDYVSAANQIIQNFYKDYDPKVYYRTGILGKSVRPLKGSTGAHCSGGCTVNIGSHSGGDYVYNLMWMQGIRGLPAGYKGHIGSFESKFDLEDISIIKETPDIAMNKLGEVYLESKKSKIDEIFDETISSMIQRIFE